MSVLVHVRDPAAGEIDTGTWEVQVSLVCKVRSGFYTHTSTDTPSDLQLRYYNNVINV